MTAALELRGITKSFDGFKAIADACFDVRPGEVHALLGENGAGKSSLMNVAAGLYAPDEGRIFMDGAEIRLDGPLGAKRVGIGMVHQHYKLVKAFNAVDNVLMTLQDGGYRNLAVSVVGRLNELCRKLQFEVDLKRPVGMLSIAEQQRIEILKVLLADAKVLILDEPTAVLTDREAESLLTTVRNLATAGSAVVLVTHKLREVRSFADRVTVMRGGRTIATVKAAEKSLGELAVLIVGEQLQEISQPSQSIGEPILQLIDVTAARGDGHHSLKDVSLTVRAGEIYGVAGVAGNGQMELAEVMMGVNRALKGRIEIAGAGDVTHAPSMLRRMMGVVSIPADRQSYALAGDLGISDNYAVAGVMHGKYGGWLNVDRRAISQDTQAAVKAYDVQGVRSLKQRAALLSGGNAQKLVIAREFAGVPRVVLAHSPSRGLDVRATAAVHDSIRKARDRGAAVLLISEDLDEILLLSDRVGVMNRGKVTAEFTVPIDRKSVGEAMVSHG